MADNTTLNPGTGGDVIATDDIGGVKHELVKIEFGVADSATMVSSTNPLPVTDYTPAAILNGKVTVSTAGTRVQLSVASAPIKSVSVRAGSTNTGIIYVGNSTVDSTNGFELLNGDIVSIDVNDLDLVYVDASINSQYVTYIADN